MNDANAIEGRNALWNKLLEQVRPIRRGLRGFCERFDKQRLPSWQQVIDAKETFAALGRPDPPILPLYDELLCLASSVADGNEVVVLDQARKLGDLLLQICQDIAVEEPVGPDDIGDGNWSLVPSRFGLPGQPVWEIQLDSTDATAEVTTATPEVTGTAEVTTATPEVTATAEVTTATQEEQTGDSIEPVTPTESVDVAAQTGVTSTSPATTVTPTNLASEPLTIQKQQLRHILDISESTLRTRLKKGMIPFARPAAERAQYITIDVARFDECERKLIRAWTLRSSSAQPEATDAKDRTA